MGTLQEWFRLHADAGFRVFPLWGIDRDTGRCGCGNSKCNQPGKHPRAAGWQYTPEWSEEQLDTICEHQLSTGYGILVSGLLVVDIDARNGGLESFSRLQDDIPAIGGAGMVVNTGSGGGSRHLYFALDPDNPVALVQHLDAYPGIDFKSTGFVVGPGSQHASGGTYELVVGSPSDITPAPGDLVDLLRKPHTHRAYYQGAALDVDDATVADMLAHVPPDCEYETWIRCGMAVHHATGGSGFSLWHDWSASGDKFPGRDTLDRHWHSFGKAANPVTIGTLVHYATQNGYQQPVTFSVYEDQLPQDDTAEPLDTTGVDALRPPGLVGQLVDWLNSQCRYPRERLAVAAALVAMGNIAGLRYTDDKDGITLNLLALCVSASATGKEAILQGASAIHEAVGIQSAVVGNIKSEQEIVRNLVRHQAAYYLIDEVGYLLQKIESARQKGGAAYLDGVIAIIMAAYSKADGSFLISGDLKDEVRRELTNELKQCDAKIDNNEDPDGFFERRRRHIKDQALPQIDTGLQRPFLSMMGMTTPVSFDGLVTVEQATNGFIGRCLLIREPETNPRRKRGWRRPPRQLPESLRMMLCALHDGGNFAMERPPRVEYHGERVPISTDEAAIDMLEDVADWLEDYAEHHKGRTGLEAIVRRAYEMVAKISTILALGEGVRTTEHVRWAFALVRQDMETKLSLATANIEDGSADALRVRTLEAVGEGETRGTIRKRVARAKKYTPQDADNMIDHLVKQGVLQEVEREHPRTRKKHLVYSRA